MIILLTCISNNIKTCLVTGVDLLKFTFGFFDDMADAQPMAHMMKSLVPWIAPLIDVITRAGPDQVVQCIITSSYKAKNSTGKKKSPK